MGESGAERPPEDEGEAIPRTDRIDLKDVDNQVRDLRDFAQGLLTDKIYLENEIGQLKKRSSRLEEELRHLRSPPFIIGNVQDVLDDDRAIVRSSNGTVFLVSRNRRLPEAELRPGTRVALNQDSLSIIDVLTDAHDPLVAAAEIIDSPNLFMQILNAGVGNKPTIIQDDPCCDIPQIKSSSISLHESLPSLLINTLPALLPNIDRAKE